MATTTPNFGWTVPTSSDLVKNGATAIETLGDSIDASMVDLKGGTSNQVLAKNSNTDMDFKWVTPAAGGGGKVLQVVSAVSNTGVTNSTTTYADTGLTVSITPTASTSKILVMVTIDYRKNDGNAQSSANFKLLRGATTLQTSTDLVYTNSAIYNASTYALTYYDSPATTSATTYKLQFANNTAANSIRVIFGDANSSANITVMEIGA